MENKTNIAGYAPLMVIRWEDLSLAANVPMHTLQLMSPDGCSGIILVYDTLDALRKDYPDVPVIVLKGLDQC